MPEVTPPAPYKPGIKTSELYVTVASILTTVAVLGGLIGPNDQEPVLQALVAVVSSVTTAVVSAIYIWGRIMAKLKE